MADAGGAIRSLTRSAPARKPPFDNLKVRLAVSHAIDRQALIRAVHEGAGVPGAAMAPKPYGVWGLLERNLAALPGMGKPEAMKARARSLLAEVGINELKQVGIEASLRQVESAQWPPMVQ